MLQMRRPGWEKHKVAPEGKGLAPAIAAVWTSLWSIAAIDSRPLLFAFSLCAGVVVYFSQQNEPAMGICLLATISAGIFFLATRWVWQLSRLNVPALILLGLTGGYTAATVRTATVAAPVILSETRPLMLEGWVREVEPGTKGDRLRIEVHALSGLSADETPAYVRVTHRLNLNVAPGRFVRCFVVLRPPPSPSLQGDYDFRRQAWFEQLGGVGYVMGRCRGGPLGAPKGTLRQLSLEVSSFRRRLAEHVKDAAGERAGALLRRWSPETEFIGDRRPGGAQGVWPVAPARYIRPAYGHGRRACFFACPPSAGFHRATRPACGRTETGSRRGPDRKLHLPHHLRRQCIHTTGFHHVGCRVWRGPG